MERKSAANIFDGPLGEQIAKRRQESHRSAALSCVFTYEDSRQGVEAGLAIWKARLSMVADKARRPGSDLLRPLPNGNTFLHQLSSMHGGGNLFSSYIGSDWQMASDAYAAFLAKLPKEALDERNSAGRTPLHGCCYSGAVILAAALVKAGADFSIADGSGDTPLHDASRMGRAEVARMLLDAGADPKALNSSGQTPLQVCQAFDEMAQVWSRFENGVSKRSGLKARLESMELHSDLDERLVDAPAPAKRRL